MQQYIISVTDIVRANGLSCPPDKINIVFEQPECADVVCVQNNNTVTISIPDGCDQKCFYGVASCDVECDTCGDMRIEICPCMDNTGCGPCSICDPVKHICISNCPPGQKCSEECGGCAECDSETPCPGDKVCQGCKCQCPTDKPYPGPNGTCIDCRTKKDCPPCHECTRTGCKPIVCTTGVCNDEKGCVECNTKTDCVGVNKCCIDNKCDCCPGFVKDKDGNCVQIDCTKDSDCGDCQSCDIASGKCKDTICPPGTVCVKDGCLPICDCDSPLCDSSNACIRLNESTCYCSSCVGSCADGQPCGPGCYCDKTDDKCKPNPCGGSCQNGTDCGPGCGCNPLTGQCEPCGAVPCGTPCNNLLGCGCPDGTNCSDLPDCGGDCVNGGDCPPGCGCYQGKCVNCANFSCTDCAGVDGCKCTDGVNCDSDPDRGCKDKAELIKNEENCSLTAKFDIKSPCSCPVITAGVKQTGFSSGLINDTPTNEEPQGDGTGQKPLSGLKTSFTFQLRKGSINNAASFINLPLLNDSANSNIFDNELPVSGNIKATSYAIYRENNVTLPKVQIEQRTISIANKTSIPFSNISIGDYISGDKTLISYEVEFEISSKISFPNNCNYNVLKLFKIAGNVSVQGGVYTTSTVLNTYIIKSLQSNDLRNPDLTWYKSKTSTFTKENIFRKVYVPKGQDGNYQDTLYGPGEIPVEGAYPLNTPEGELWNKFNYKVSSSCSCDEASLTNLFFCNVEKLKYKFTGNTCQKSIQITENFVPCPINDVHNKFNKAGYTIPSDTETSYALLFNNKLVYEWKGTLNSGYIIDYDETITSVTIVQSIGGIEVCRKDYSHPFTLPNPIVDFKCNDGENQSVVKVTINQEIGDPKISNIKFGVNNTYFDQFEVNNTFTNPVVKIIPKTLIGNNKLFILYTFTNGCTKKVEFNQCNTQVVPEAVPSIYSYSQCTPIGPNPKIVVNAFGFGENVTYSLNGGTPQTSNEFLDKTAGNYVITVTDGVQTQAANITIENPVAPEVYLLDNTICVGGNTKLVIKADTGTQFTVNTPTSTITATTVGGIYELPIPYSPSAAGDYTVSLITSNGKICPSFTKTVSLAIGGQNYTPTIEIESGSYCVGSPIRFRILNGGSSTFMVTSNGTGTITSMVVAGNEYVGLYTPNVPNGQIAITGLVNDTCNTTTNPVLNVNTTQGPIITGTNANCQNDNTVTVTVNTQNATSVKIQNVNAVESAPGSGVWTRSNIIGITNATIEVSNGNCILTQEIEIPNCTCPPGTLLITSNGNLCAPGNAEFAYSNFIDQTPDASWEYFWQTLNIGTWVQVGLQQLFNPSLTPDLIYGLTANNSITARLVLINMTNNCVYNSNELTVTASSSLSIPTITMSPSNASVGTSVTFNTQPGYANYVWTINGTNVSGNTNSITYMPTVSGSVTVSVIVTNSSGCTQNSIATNFTIGSNCPDIPVSYIPSGSCSDIQVQITNNVGVPINYTATGTGSLGTAINQTGVVPGSNIIIIDTDILQTSEQVPNLSFVFTYQQGASPICTINKTLSTTYTRCQYGLFDFSNAQYAVLPCNVTNWRYNFSLSFSIPCNQQTGIKTFTYIVRFNGNTVNTDTNAAMLINTSDRCTIKQIDFGVVGGFDIPYVGYGGTTGVFEVEVLDGLTSLGTIVLNPALTIPVSC